jgi:hypothetical protein
MWDEDLFRVDSIEYAGSWISLFGSFVDDAFEYVITGIMELALELKEQPPGRNLLNSNMHFRITPGF